MKKKLTKTIFTIVFVVFLGLVKSTGVDAYYAYCHYKAEDSSSRVLIYITDSFTDAKGTYVSGNTSSSGLRVRNWASSGTTSTSYFGYDDAWQNDHCPQYLLYSTKGKGRNLERLLYVSDSANLETYKSVLKANYNNVTVLTIESNTYPNKKSEYGTYIESRICDCDNGKSYTIAKDGSLDAFKVGGKTVQNWLSTSNFAAIDGVKSNECLNLIYGSSGSLYLSDDKHYEEIYSVSGGSEVVSCKLNSQTPVNVEKEKPSYNPPTVRDDIIKPLGSSSNTYSCGNGYLTNIPSSILRVVKIIYIILQVLVPIVLVLLGSLDLAKAITGQKEDEIKQGQKTFIKRLIAAIIIFFVFIVVKLVVGVFSNDDNEIISCMNCFLEGGESCVAES